MRAYNESEKRVKKKETETEGVGATSTKWRCSRASGFLRPSAVFSYQKLQEARQKDRKRLKTDYDTQTKSASLRQQRFIRALNITGILFA